MSILILFQIIGPLDRIVNLTISVLCLDVLSLLHLCTNHTLIFFLHVTYSVFFVNNIYLFHPCSVIPLYVVL